MEKKIKVINLCTNRILASGIAEVFSKSEVDYEHKPYDKLLSPLSVCGANVLIVEKMSLNHQIIQEIVNSSDSALISFDLDSNKVTLVMRETLELEKVDDLLGLIKTNAKNVW